MFSKCHKKILRNPERYWELQEKKIILSSLLRFKCGFFMLSLPLFKEFSEWEHDTRLSTATIQKWLFMTELACQDTELIGPGHLGEFELISCAFLAEARPTTSAVMLDDEFKLHTLYKQCLCVLTVIGLLDFWAKHSFEPHCCYPFGIIRVFIPLENKLSIILI